MGTPRCTASQIPQDETLIPGVLNSKPKTAKSSQILGDVEQMFWRFDFSGDGAAWLQETSSSWKPTQLRLGFRLRVNGVRV